MTYQAWGEYEIVKTTAFALCQCECILFFNIKYKYYVSVGPARTTGHN